MRSLDTKDGRRSSFVSIESVYDHVHKAYSSVQQAPAGDDDHYGAVGFGVKPHTFHNLTLTFQPNSAAGDKFKLVEVITC